MEDQEPMVEIPSTDGVKNITMSLPPNISVDENTTSLNIDFSTSMNVDNMMHQAKSEKGVSEEGFCCVMSMHDGVVL